MDIDKPDVNDNEIDARPQRKRHHYDPYRFNKTFGGSAFIVTANPDPIIYQQAIKSPDNFRWKEVIEVEFR